MDQPLSSAVEQLERAMIHWAIRESGGRVNAAATLRGLSRKGLFLKRRRLGIDTVAVS
jgi:DNA-binding NtrC family response regulator